MRRYIAKIAPKMIGNNFNIIALQLLRSGDLVDLNMTATVREIGGRGDH